MVRTCGENRRGLRRQEGDGNVSTMRWMRGRPKRRWLDRMRGYMKQKGLSGEEV